MLLFLKVRYHLIKIREDVIISILLLTLILSILSVCLIDSVVLNKSTVCISEWITYFNILSRGIRVRASSILGTLNLVSFYLEFEVIRVLKEIVCGVSCFLNQLSNFSNVFLFLCHWFLTGGIKACSSRLLSVWKILIIRLLLLELLILIIFTQLLSSVTLIVATKIIVIFITWRREHLKTSQSTILDHAIVLVHPSSITTHRLVIMSLEIVIVIIVVHVDNRGWHKIRVITLKSKEMNDSLNIIKN